MGKQAAAELAHKDTQLSGLRDALAIDDKQIETLQTRLSAAEREIDRLRLAIINGLNPAEPHALEILEAALEPKP